VELPLPACELFVCLSLLTDVDGRLTRMLLADDGSSSLNISREVTSPSLPKDCKHCLAVAAVDAVQLAVIAPANETNSGMLLLSHLCFMSFVRHGIAYLPHWSSGCWKWW